LPDASQTTPERAALIDELARRIVAASGSRPLRVAIDGVDAAGKTTLADELVAPIERLGRPALRASVDGFHRAARLRHRRGTDSPEGYYRDCFDYPALIAELLDPLGPGGSRRCRPAVFDYRTDAPVDAATLQAAEDLVLLFDGVFLLRPELRPYWDLSIFVQADFDVTLARAERRDEALFGGAEQTRRRYLLRYLPGQRLYLAECQPTSLASWVVVNDDPAHPRLASGVS
jgi:uridine kinase